MLTIQRANVVLEIDDEDLNYYMSMGYSQINPVTGEIIKGVIPTDVKELQGLYLAQQAEIKALKAEIENLKKPKTRKTTK